MDKKIASGMVVALVVVGGLCFYGGVQYGRGSSAPSLQGGPVGFDRNARAGQMNGATASQRQGRGGGMIAGSVISKDDKSVTIKLRDGGSQIVFFSGNTSFMRNTSGTVSDIDAGKEVSVFGSQNPDGSLNAQSIQIRN